MKLVTLFTIPKPFAGHTGRIQTNAVASWRQLGSECDVLLCGDEAGASAVAESFGAHHYGQLRRTSAGVPLLSDAFRAAQTHASVYKCYTNADIVFVSDLLQVLRALDALGLQEFLIVGQRTDLDVSESLDLTSPRGELSLLARAAQQGRLAPVVCKDYFIYPSALFAEIPDFAVGRGNWDNWMVANAARCGIPVIDATEVITAIHQNHDYTHVAGGKQSAYLKGEDAQRNSQLGGGKNIIRGARVHYALRWEAGELVLRRTGFWRFWKDLPRFLRLVKELFLTRDRPAQGRSNGSAITK